VLPRWAASGAVIALQRRNRFGLRRRSALINQMDDRPEVYAAFIRGADWVTAGVTLLLTLLSMDFMQTTRWLGSSTG